MAIIARCRMPPDSWCGYDARPLLRRGDADRGQHVHGARTPPRASDKPWCSTMHLGDLPAHRHHRVQRRHRLLEHHRDARAAQRCARPTAAGRAARAPPAGSSPPTRPGRRHQAHQRQRGQRLAAAAFADHAQGAAGTDAEADAGNDLAGGETTVRSAHLAEQPASFRVPVLGPQRADLQARWARRPSAIAARHAPRRGRTAAAPATARRRCAASRPTADAASPDRVPSPSRRCRHPSSASRKPG